MSRPTRLALAMSLLSSAAVIAMPGATVAHPPSPQPSQVATPAPSATPFAWPTIPAPESVALPAPFEPDGPPAASRTRHGVRLELWLSAPTVGSGEWIQALVRTTNTGRDAAWSWSGECGSSGTRIAIDLSVIIPPGVEQSGNAAAFKRRAIREAYAMASGFTPWRYLEPAPTGSVIVRALAECTTPEVPLRLAPGETLEERFAWYPTGPVHGDRSQPLPPGTVTATVSWPFIGRGARPAGHPRRFDDDFIRPITTTATLDVTGEGPAAPSIPELIDVALADPTFRGWVDEDPDRETWTDVWLSSWSPPYDHHLYLDASAPDGGVVSLELLTKGTNRAIIVIDPWTGDVFKTLRLQGV